MSKRFLTIWFRHFKTDWFCIRQPDLIQKPFVLTVQDHGRLIVTAVNDIARTMGVDEGMVLADVRAIIPSLLVFEDESERYARILKRFAGWFIRFSPSVSIHLPDGITLDATGCSHLWSGEQSYLDTIVSRLQGMGYNVRVAIADTIGAGWAITRFVDGNNIIEPNQQSTTLLPLPAASLRLEPQLIEKLQKLGLRQVKDFIGLPRAALFRRFGADMILKLDQALGHQEEITATVFEVLPYLERLPCLEPIVTATGIEIALERLLETICSRLKNEEKGLRLAIFKGYRIDGKTEQVQIGTNRPSHNTIHLFKLFQEKIPTMEPGFGIELFTLEVSGIEPLSALQEKLWESSYGVNDAAISELLDRLANKIGDKRIHRYVPDAHYWPERSLKPAVSLHEQKTISWRSDKPRPLQLLPVPAPIEVTAPIPDYPPMMFRYKGRLHTIKKADGPERIEREWWLETGPLRDYYYVEDEEGQRYWVFRSGHYGETSNRWFLHGFFA